MSPGSSTLNRSGSSCGLWIVLDCGHDLEPGRVEAEGESTASREQIQHARPFPSTQTLDLPPNGRIGGSCLRTDGLRQISGLVDMDACRVFSVNAHPFPLAECLLRLPVPPSVGVSASPNVQGRLRQQCTREPLGCSAEHLNGERRRTKATQHRCRSSDSPAVMLAYGTDRRLLARSPCSCALEVSDRLAEASERGATRVRQEERFD